VAHEHLCLTPYLSPKGGPTGWPKRIGLAGLQHLPLVLTLDAYKGSLTLTLPRHPGHLNRLVLVVATSTHVSAAILSDVVALSRQLRTPPLPATRVPVGYWWQPVLPAPVTQAQVADRPGNARLYHSVGKVQQLHKQPRVAPCACWALFFILGYYGNVDSLYGFRIICNPLTSYLSIHHLLYSFVASSQTIKYLVLLIWQ